MYEMFGNPRVKKSGDRPTVTLIRRVLPETCKITEKDYKRQSVPLGFKQATERPCKPGCFTGTGRTTDEEAAFSRNEILWANGLS